MPQAAQAIHGHPYDGATLRSALAQTATLTGITSQQAQQAVMDQRFRGNKHHSETVEMLVAYQALSQASQCQ